MESDQLIQICIDTCEDHKGVDIVAYDVQGVSTLTDYYLIVSGNSTPHLRALKQSLELALKPHGLLPRSVEGTPESQWILVDYEDALIHIFHADAREHYNIEALLDPERLIHPVPAAG